MTSQWPLTVKIVPQASARGLPFPQFATLGSAGLDLTAASFDNGLPSTLIYPMQRMLVGTGYAWEIPEGFEGQIRPRSGIALNHGITVLNAPGTIDSDFRSEVAVLLINLGDEAVEIRRGDRIAQMIIAPVLNAPYLDLRVDRALTPTARGAGGFGSTGVAG